MKKILKHLKYDLLLYRHIYLIYWILILVTVGFLVNAIINGHDLWYPILDGCLILFLLFILIFRLPIERSVIRRKSDAVIILLMGLEKGLKTRFTSLMVLENEFDVLGEKENGIQLIHERIINSYINSVDEALSSSNEIGEIIYDFLVIQFTLPDNLPDLQKIIKELKEKAEKDLVLVGKEIDKFNSLTEKF